jgi:hypothetical protein
LPDNNPLSVDHRIGLAFRFVNFPVDP